MYKRDIEATKINAVFWFLISAVMFASSWIAFASDDLTRTVFSIGGMLYFGLMGIFAVLINILEILDRMEKKMEKTEDD